jgi:hypothetical protein
MADSYDADAPIAEDVRQDDLEYNPALEPESALAWLNLLKESEDAFKDYNDHCDRIDQQLASLMRLADNTRDRQFQMFWANMEVIKPAIYGNPPVPAITTKFKDRRPVPQQASEFAERCCQVSFDLTNIDELMKLVRDDLAVANRGVAWCRYENKKGKGYYSGERVCIDFKDRRDFLHSLARNWREVTWVAAASYLTRAEARKRFYRTSGAEYQRADYKVDKEAQEIGGGDARERAKFWEIWDLINQRVCWVSEGCEKILDEDDPHLELRNFFPCPKPAYGTVQRGSLVPVPDAMQYRDQLEEINTLTGRIHALAEAIEVKGFYPAGGGEIADAVEQALAIKTPGRVLVPINNWAAFGNGSKDVIVWLPIDVIAQTITGLVALRKQLIDDVYQLTGLADIMRGDTDPQETLGAQQLKTQYGTTRIRDKQEDLARFARDLVEITVEIIAEKFSDDTMIEMSQTQLPTNAMVEQAARQIVQQLQSQQQQLQLVSHSPQGQQAQAQMQQQQPDASSQMAAQSQLQIQQGMQALAQLREQPTIEQVLTFLKDNRSRAFVLDIETDSTILVDENAEKQRRGEFVGMLAQLLPQLAQMIGTEPQTAPFCGEVLKFAVAPYRAGRSLDGAIDDLVEQMKQKGDQPPGTDPATAQQQTAIQIEQMKLQQQDKEAKAKLDFQQQQLQQADRHKQWELQAQQNAQYTDQQGQAAENATDLAVQQEKMQESREAHQMEMARTQQQMTLERQKATNQMQHQAATANQRLQQSAMTAQAAMRRQQMMPNPGPRRV